MTALLVLLAVPAVVVWLGFFYGLFSLQRSFRATARVDFKSREDNDDRVANENSVNILSEAEEDIEIYDDGNNFEESPYNSESFIHAVRQKLDENQGFKLLCLFNCDELTDFRTEFGDHERVDIRVRTAGGRPDDVHYKIVDGGRRAYISKHGLNERTRKYRIVDCGRVERRDFELAVEILFEGVQQDLDDFTSVRGVAHG